MSEAPADVIGALVGFLLADADVAASVAMRGFGAELPAGEAASMPRTAFVLRPSGGATLTSGSFAEVDTQRVDLFSYGRTPAEAGILADLIALKLRRLERATVAGTLLHWAKSAGGFSSGREPEADWPRAWRSFQVMYALAKVGG
jgi:hypothetical protein